MSEQDSRQAIIKQRPTTNDREAWKAYWKTQGHPWRTEPEIDIERQKYLNTCLAVVSHVHAFKDIILSRADVECLLAKHRKSDREEDWWIYKRWQVRTGLDLQGANLCKVDLSGLPLEAVNLRESYLERAILSEAHLNMAVLCDAHLEGAVLRETHLQGANLSGAHLEKAYLSEAHLEGAMFALSFLEEAYLYNAYLERANFVKAHLERANLGGAHLEGAYFYDAHLEEASFRYAHLERANLGGAYLGGCNLSGAFFSNATTLDKVILTDEKFGCVSLCSVRWGDVDLSVIDWRQVSILGDEQEAYRSTSKDGKAKSAAIRFEEYQIAVRANRQLAVALQGQGLNEEAARFSYRAQKLHRIVLRKQKKIGAYFFSGFLDLITGYGYKPWRSFLAYLLVIIGFAIGYYLIGQIIGPSLSPVGAWVFSMTSFHGRGFFPGGIKLDDPLTILAAIEAFVGLLIEVTFIATLTQRLFGK